MYHNQIVVIVKKDGQPLREIDGKFVYLPFGSEYSLEIKNSSSVKALASIKIDGTNVLGDAEMIIPACGSETLERFNLGGLTITKGKKFKFAKLTDSGVSDPTSSKNGLIEIEVWFEKPKPVITPNPIRWTTTSESPAKKYSTDGNYFCGDSSQSSTLSVQMAMASFSPPSAQSIDMGGPSASPNGATVEGGDSRQTFHVGTFGEKEYPSTKFEIYLRGVETEITSDNKLFCTNCGKKTRFDYKFCPRCGYPVQIA